MAKRLIKIAKELNVGTSTIVEHLNRRGFDIENKPTAQITDEMEAELLKEFQKSLAIKEKADQLKIGRTLPKKEAEPARKFPEANPVKSVPKQEPVTAKATSPQTEERQENGATRPEPVSVEEDTTPGKPKFKILGKIDLDRNKRFGFRQQPEPPQKEEKPQVEQTPEQPQAEPIAELPKEEATAEPVSKQPEEQQQPIESPQQPQPATEQPVAKQEPQSEEQPEERTQPTPVEEKLNVETYTPTSVAETPVLEEKQPQPQEQRKEKVVEELLRAETPELRGLKIQGKIDIDKFDRSRKKKKKEKDKKPETSTEKRPPQGQSQQQGDKQQQGDRQQQGDKRPAAAGNPATNRSTPAGNNNGNSSSEDAKKRRRRKRKKVSTDSPGERGAARPGGAGTGGAGGGGNATRSDAPRSEANRSGGGNRRVSRQDEAKEVSQKEIEEKIKATMARLSGGGKKKRQRLRRENRERTRERQELIQQEQDTGKLQLTEFISVSELASLMNVSVTDVIMTCMNLGVIVSINQRLDAEIIELVAEEFGHEVEFISAEELTEEEEEIEEDPANLKPRAPIVTVMGHVDHGKTSLLDYIRRANVAGGEAGGITQHIGAYEVKVNDKRITFLDTPGHEAFTAMRARGAKVTDIAIIIIAADDNIMPQTKEAISHAQAAGVPMVFAINKVDKPGAAPERIKQELANMNFLVEDWGGKYQSQDISAKTGQGVEELLEKVLLEAELLELKANPDREAVGTVLEASLDKGRGYVAKTLIQTGTLKIGDAIISGEHSGKVKAMFNEWGKRVTKAGPSRPVLVLGLGGAPQAGERFKVVQNEQDARSIASRRAQIMREQANRATKRISLDEIGRRLALGHFKELNLIVKGDVDGSIEALSDALIKQSIESVQVNVIHKAVGQIIESDVLLASASDAIIIGFQVRPSLGARKLAEREGVEIKMYSIIYEAIEEVRAAIEGMLEPTKEERIVGNVEIREVYKISKVGTIAGCYVQDGKITRNTNVRVVRDGIVVYPTKGGTVGKIASLKRFKEDVKEVKAGLECGLNIENFNDIKVGDIIEGYEIVEVKQTLA